MKKIKKVLIVFIAFVNLLSFIAVLDVQAVEIEDNSMLSTNTGNVLYKWTKVTDLETLRKFISNRNEDYRLMLLGNDSVFSITQSPEPEYYVSLEINEKGFKSNKLDDELKTVIQYNQETFYTRGGLNTPYIRYTGKNTNTDTTGEAPICHFYFSDEEDNKVAQLWCRENLVRTGTGGYYYKYSLIPDGRTMIWDKSNEFVLCFPGMTYPEGYTNNIKDSVYSDKIKEQVAIGTHVVGIDQNSKWISIHENRITYKYLIENRPNNTSSYTNNDAQLFECYIGKKVNQWAFQKSFSVKSNQIFWMSDVTYIKDGVTITIEKGGKLIISGTCFNNGYIVNNGGEVVLKNDSLMTTIEPRTHFSGSIKCNSGSLIIEENAQYINELKLAPTIVLMNDSKMVNEGYIDAIQYKQGEKQYERK